MSSTLSLDPTFASEAMQRLDAATPKVKPTLRETAADLVPAPVRTFAHEHPLVFWTALIVAGSVASPLAWRALRLFPRARMAQLGRAAAEVVTPHLGAVARRIGQAALASGIAAAIGADDASAKASMT